MNQKQKEIFEKSIRKAFASFKPTIDKEKFEEMRIFCWVCNHGELNFDFEYCCEDGVRERIIDGDL